MNDSSAIQKEGILQVPAREIPPPSSISAQAQAMLAAAARAPSRAPYPVLTDTAAWEKSVAESDAFIASLGLDTRYTHLVESEAIKLGKVPSYCIKLRNPSAQAANQILFDIHGGALIAGGGDLCRVSATRMGVSHGAGTTYTPDYRMPPRFPYPASLDDCVESYRAVLALHPAEHIVVQGSSAGGNLAAALMLRLRDEGIPFPGGVILHSPEIDLTESGDTFQTNMGIDTVLVRSLMPANLLYAGGHDLSDPLVSPLFGDFTKGFPPTVLTAGTRDLFLSNAARMHRALRKAGVDADLVVSEAMPHGGFFGTPEDEELMAELRRCAERLWRNAKASAKRR